MYPHSPLTLPTLHRINTSVIPRANELRRLRNLQRLTHIFKPASEIFIVNILVLDVCAFWLPRVFNALTRGTTPNNKLEKTPHKQTGSWLRQQINRLNWSNALEETWREIASGPALFVWPTLLFGATRKLLNSSALEIKQSTLDKLVDSYQHHLKSSSNNQKQWASFIQKTLSSTTQPLDPNWLKGWSHQLSEALIAPAKQRKSQLQQLKDQLLKKTIDSNRHATHKNTFYQWDQLLLQLHKEPLKQSATEAFNNLTRFHDLIQNSLNTHRKKGIALTQALDKHYKKLTMLKAGLSIASIATTLSFLSRLAYWAQKNPTYPANRHLQYTKLSANQNPFYHLSGLHSQQETTPVLTP